MYKMLLETAVRTGDSADTTKFIIIGVVCVVAIAGVAFLGMISGKNKEDDKENKEKK